MALDSILKIHCKRCLLLLAGLPLLTFPVASHAGFKWVPVESEPKTVEPMRATPPSPKNTMNNNVPAPVKTQPAPVPSFVVVDEKKDEETEAEEQPIPLRASPPPPLKTSAPQMKVLRPTETSSSEAPVEVDKPLPIKMKRMAPTRPIKPAPAPEKPKSDALTAETLLQSKTTGLSEDMLIPEPQTTAHEPVEVMPKVEEEKEDDTPKVEASYAAHDTGFVIVHGFGSEVPLVMALQQIVPAAYAFSFGTDVNPGQAVSWDGGKSWDKVIADMLAPLGLVARLKENMLYIYNPKGPGTRSSTAPTPHQNHHNMAHHEPLALTSPSQNLNRRNITDPGAVKTSQPVQTMIEVREMDSSDTAETESQVYEQQLISSLQNDQSAAPYFWEAKQGHSLRKVLERWTRDANVTLVWGAAHDYTIASDVLVNDSFKDAVKVLFAESVSGPSGGPLLRLIDTPSEKTSGLLIIQDRS